MYISVYIYIYIYDARRSYYIKIKIEERQKLWIIWWEYSKLLENRRHDWVGQLIHLALCKGLEFIKRLMYSPENVQEKSK